LQIFPLQYHDRIFRGEVIGSWPVGNGDSYSRSSPFVADLIYEYG